MADHSRYLSRPLYRRDMRWEPFCEETLPSQIYRRDLGLPPFLEPADLSWIQWAQRRMAASQWPGYITPPLFTPTPPYSGPSAEQPRGVTEIRTGPESWKINLDVSCFSPREITIRTREGYLEISGNHEDRQDEYGLVTKGFSRKYNRLPAGSDLRHIRSALSGGVLTVEAPLPSTAQEIPVEVIIPVQVEKGPERRAEAKAGDLSLNSTSQENTEGARADVVFSRGKQEKTTGLSVAASALQVHSEELSDADVCPPTGGQKNNGQHHEPTASIERVYSNAGVEPEEDRPMEREHNGEVTSQEEASKKEAMMSGQANQDAAVQESEDLPPAPEGQTSTLDSQHEEKKQTESRWGHRDTKWTVRSTKWSTQQY